MECHVIEKVANYLDVKVSNVRCNERLPTAALGGTEYSGTATIIFEIVKAAKLSQWEDAEEKFAIYQWLEVASLLNFQDYKTVLKNLNSYLENYSYLVGFRRSIADVVFYYALYDIMASLNPSEKEAVLNVCRWFDHMQSFDEVRQNGKLVNFASNNVLSHVSHIN